MRTLSQGNAADRQKSQKEGAPPLSRFMRQGGDFDLLELAVDFDVPDFQPKSYPFIFGRAQASTIFLGSIASLSTCSSMIFPSFPTRKFTRRGAWYSSL